MYFDGASFDSKAQSRTNASQINWIRKRIQKKIIIYIYIKIKKEGFLQVDVLYESISKILTSSFCEYCESPGFSRGRH